MMILTAQQHEQYFEFLCQRWLYTLREILALKIQSISESEGLTFSHVTDKCSGILVDWNRLSLLSAGFKLQLTGLEWI